MGFLRPKMPAPPPPPPAPPVLPPAMHEAKYVDPLTGEDTTAAEQAAIKLDKKRKGYTETILTSTQGDTSEADIYQKTLLGA
jgi:hypothetical protein